MTSSTLEEEPQVHSYRVEHRSGCVLIFGELLIPDLVALTGSRGSEEVMSPDVARMAGANIAFGPKGALDKLRESLADAALQHEMRAHPELDADLVRWLAIGQRGRSSDAIVNHLTGALGGEDAEDRFAFPHDPDDLRRCRLLLEQVPSLAG